MKMNILSWLKKVISKFNFFSKLEAESTIHTSYSSSCSPSRRAGLVSGSGQATILSEKVNEVTEKNFSEELVELQEKSKRLLAEVEKTKNLVYLGFVAFLLMVAAIVFGYWRFVYDSGIKDDYKYKFSERIIVLETNNDKQEEEISFLKQKNIELSEIITCIKYKKYWQYEECFR